MKHSSSTFDMSVMQTEIKMKVYRSVLAKEVDVNNLGCHTTKDWKIAASFDPASNSYNYVKEDGSKQFMIWISVKSDQINVDATAESNNGYPHEKEVVLLPNQEVKVEIYCKGELVYKGKANTGSRYDKWVAEYL